MFKSLALIAALAFGCFATANADPINGSLAVVGFTDTWNSNSVSFTDPIAVIGDTSGTYTTLNLNNTPAYLYSGFVYTPGSYASDPQGVFLADGSAVSLFITNITTGSVSGNTLTVIGTGMAYAPGYDPTDASFAFTSSNNGSTSFEITLNAAPAPVPEPESLALFGTGLLGIVGIARRKFSV